MFINPNPVARIRLEITGEILAEDIVEVKMESWYVNARFGLSRVLPVISIFGLFSSLTLASLPSIKSEISDVACMVNQAMDVNEVKKDSSGRLGFCSGTFLSPHLFLTAAHCLSDQPSNIGIFRKNQQKKLFISCPGNQDYQVEASIPNLKFFMPYGSNRFFNEKGELKLSASTGSVYGNDYNYEEDFAVLVVKNGPTSRNFPSLSRKIDKPTSCQLLGFARATNDFGRRSLCDRQSGIGCLRPVNFNNQQDFNQKYFELRDTQVSFGDSGSGIICNISGVSTIIAVFTNFKGTLNLSYQIDFLDNFRLLNFEQLIEEAGKVRVSSDSYALFDAVNKVNLLANDRLKFSCDKPNEECKRFWAVSLEIVSDKQLLDSISKEGIAKVWAYEGLPSEPLFDTHKDDWGNAVLLINVKSSQTNIRQALSQK